MYFSHISIGGGITGLETIISTFAKIKKELQKSQNAKKRIRPKKITFAIIDKNPENIPGGVAYGFSLSRYGYFNNPIRLSPTQFTTWLLYGKNKKKLESYLKRYGGYTGKEWLKKNKNILFSSKANKQKEMYIPRAFFNIWMEERLILLLLQIKKIHKKMPITFEIKFFKGEVIAIKNSIKNYRKIIFKNGFCEELNYKITNNPFKKLTFNVKKKKLKSIFSITQNIGIGLPPPKQLATAKAQKNNCYIWDFYVQGSTALLKEKIFTLNKSKKKIVAYFIGYKAGLLESLPELLQIIIKKKINIKIICSSKNLESIQAARLSLNKNEYKLKVMVEKNLHKINTAKKLYLSILKEFQISISNGYKKYDAWTQILNKNVLNKFIKNFGTYQKNLYNDVYHNKVRNITRFTYPETLSAREKLYKKKILVTKKESVKKVDVERKRLVVITKNENHKSKKYICDLVINVSGPLNAGKIKNEIPLVKSLKQNGSKTNDKGFFVSNNFELVALKNIYIPGILARGFNPERKTIIQAILENSNIVGQSIAKTLIRI